MTHILLPQMVQRKKGVIISLSSASGIKPLPFLAEYSATKAYNNFLGSAIQYEYQDSGIISQVKSSLKSDKYEMQMFVYSQLVP